MEMDKKQKINEIEMNFGGECKEAPSIVDWIKLN